MLLVLDDAVEKFVCGIILKKIVSQLYITAGEVCNFHPTTDARKTYVQSEEQTLLGRFLRGKRKRGRKRYNDRG